VATSTAGVALVTGAAAGIGRAIVERLSADGFQVALADIDLDAASATTLAVSRINGVEPFAVQVDVSDYDNVQRMVAMVLDRAGRIDVLVNNAGISGPAAPVVEYPEQEWRRVLAVDLDGVFYCCRAVLPTMLQSGYGRIVNIASISGKEGNPNMSAYSAAKGGVIAFTKALGKELATTGIMVNCITPAVIETGILSQLTDAAVDYMVSRIPMGRVGRPAEVAAMVSWLASDECSFTTAAVFDLSGGRATY
jgi:NAD(P)-dependent dehydrogenase (short-subunit alcohol dehydrogenase family)